MYRRAVHALEDPDEIRKLIVEHPWAVLVARDDSSVLASHLPCFLDPQRDGDGLDDLVLLAHVAKADPITRALRDASREALLIFQGAHGYVSPSWYGEGPHVGTWNFTVAHVYGTVEMLEGGEAFAVLELTQERLERGVEGPVHIDDIADYAHRIAKATAPFRLSATRIEAKAKLSGDKPVEVRRRVVEALEKAGPHRNPELAQEMRRHLQR